MSAEQNDFFDKISCLISQMPFMLSLDAKLLRCSTSLLHLIFKVGTFLGKILEDTGISKLIDLSCIVLDDITLQLVKSYSFPFNDWLTILSKIVDDST